jgi:hypothetical protein
LTNLHKIDIFQSAIINQQSTGWRCRHFFFSGEKAWIGKIKDKDSTPKPFISDFGKLPLKYCLFLPRIHYSPHLLPRYAEGQYRV